MMATSITPCLRRENMDLNLFFRRAICQICCYRCKKYGHKANKCRGPYRGCGQFRNRYCTNGTNQRPIFYTKNNYRTKQNANTKSRPVLQPLMVLPPPKHLTDDQFKPVSVMPDYIPLDVWNPYINFPTAHHVFREGQWWINRSTFEIDKFYREREESEEVIADAASRGVPHGKVTDESDKGYEGEDPGGFFKFLGKCEDNGQILTISRASVAEGTENKSFAQNRFKRTRKWPVRPKIRPTYRRAKIFRPYGIE